MYQCFLSWDMMNKLSVLLTVIGFAVTVLTFINTYVANKKLKYFKGKLLFNTKIQNVLKDIKEANSEFVTISNEKDMHKIKPSLINLSLSIEDLLSINTCKSENREIKRILRQIEIQSQCYHVTCHAIHKKETTEENLNEVYWNVSKLIKRIERKIQNNKITEQYEE